MDLIEAFRRAKGAGGLEIGYRRVFRTIPTLTRAKFLRRLTRTPGVVCTGFQTGQGLAELYASAGFLCCPLPTRGCPIALLEALSYGLPAVASDIPANLEVGLPADTISLSAKSMSFGNDAARFRIARPLTTSREARRAWVAARYDWRDIAHETMKVYQAVASGRSGRVSRQVNLGKASGN